MGRFTKELLAVLVAALPITANAYDTHELTEVTFEYLRQVANETVEASQGKGMSMEPDGLTYIYGSYETDYAKIGHATEKSYSGRNTWVANRPDNAGLKLDPANRCLVTGLTRGEAVLVEMLTQRQYGAEGKWSPPKAVDPSNTHTSTEVFKAADYDERCKRMKAHADMVVMMRTDEVAERMKDKTVQLHGATRGTPYTGVPAPRPLPITTPDAANTNAVPEPSVKAPVAVRAFEAVDTIVSLPERTLWTLLGKLILTSAKLALIVGIIAGFAAAVYAAVPLTIATTGTILLTSWTIYDLINGIAWLGSLVSWAFA